MGYVFISYSHSDAEFVDKLAEALTSNGINIWVDRFQLQPGANWVNDIESTLSQADVLFFVISSASAQSAWIKEEINAAVYQRRTHQGKLIIPILIDDPINMPLPLTTIQWVDFRRDFDGALRALIDALPISVRATAPLTPLIEKSKGYFFLSFAREDGDFISSLRVFLFEHGYGYWDFLQSKRDYGLHFYREIEDKIDQAAGLISILSPDWRVSKWAPLELLYAEENDIPTLLLMVRKMQHSILTVGRLYIDFVENTTEGFSILKNELARKNL